MLKILSVIDEYTRECLMLKVACNFKAADVVDALNNVLLLRGVPEHFRRPVPGRHCLLSHMLLSLVEKRSAATRRPGSPWANGYVESFHGRLRDVLLKRELFTTLLEAQVLIENWWREYNTVRPHSALGYRPPAPVAFMPNSSAAG